MKHQNLKTKSYEVAAWWHNQGVSVIPISGTSKKCPIKWQEYQFKKATIEELEKWFIEKNFNVAIVTGEYSGVTVLDIDPPKGKQSIIDHGITLDPETRMHNTPRGGEHWFYKYNPEIKQTQDILPNVDIRNDGGYVVVYDGQNRKVGFDKDVKDFKTLPTYEALVKKDFKEIKTNKTPQKTAISDLLNNGAAKGSRHQAVVKLVGHFRHYSTPLATTLATLKMWNTKNNPPLSDYELTNQIYDLYGRYEETEKPLEIKPMTMGELVSKKVPIPSEMYILDGLLTKGGTSIVASAPKVGKSQFAISLGYSLANGWQYLGRSCWNKEYKVLYVAMERSELSWLSRIKRISDKNGVKDNFHFVRLSAHKNLVFELQKLALENNYELIIIDMITQAINTNNENEYLNTYKEISRILKDTADKTQAHVMGLYHNGKSKNKSVVDSVLGSTAIAGATDQVIRLQKKKDGTRVVDTEGNDGEEIIKPLRLIEDPLTGFVSSGGVFVNEELEKDAIEFIKNNPSANQTEIKKGVQGRNEDIEEVLKVLEENGKLTKTRKDTKGRPSFNYEFKDE